MSRKSGQWPPKFHKRQVDFRPYVDNTKPESRHQWLNRAFGLTFWTHRNPSMAWMTKNTDTQLLKSNQGGIMSRKFVIEIDLENAAFGEPGSIQERLELDRLLTLAKSDVFAFGVGRQVRRYQNINRNTVGRAEVRES